MTDRPPPPPRALPRTITALVVISVVVNVLIAVAVAVGAGYLIDVSHQNALNAARIHASQLEACRASNIARARDVAIWNRLLAITPAQRAAETPAQRAEVTQLEHLVKLKDTAVGCAALYPGNG